jgi:hypothetical protein
MVWNADTGELALPPLRMLKDQLWFAEYSSDGRFILTRCRNGYARLWDASTGDAVTPLLPQGDYYLDYQYNRDMLMAGNEMVSIDRPFRIRVTPLSPTTLPVSILQQYSRVVANARLASNDSPIPIAPTELAVLMRQLQLQQPDLFQESSAAIRKWHESQIPPPDTPAHIEAGIFHLEQLAHESSQDSETRKRLEAFKARRIPSRAPDLPRALLALDHAFTSSFESLTRGEFTQLPRGRQKLAGTEFDLRGLIRLNRLESGYDNMLVSDYPDAFQPPNSVPVRVHQHCRTLRFLQVTEGADPKDGTEIGSWIIRYSNDTQTEWPLIYGEQLRGWWWIEGQGPREASQAVLVWTGKAAHPTSDLTNGVVRLFKATWTNPHPELEISEIQLRAASMTVQPIVLAVTAE